MLSLLIISNNPKADLIQSFMQPLVKAKIDLVADFEHGLNEIFDKSPNVVIIQEHIEGVACEAIARYIQQMLGDDAPDFVMIHEGNAKIRPVKDLLEVIVDLDQTDEMLVAEIISVLKSIAGDDWDKVDDPTRPDVESEDVPEEVGSGDDTLMETATIMFPVPDPPTGDQMPGFTAEQLEDINNTQGADFETAARVEPDLSPSSIFHTDAPDVMLIQAIGTVDIQAETAETAGEYVDGGLESEMTAFSSQFPDTQLQTDNMTAAWHADYDPTSPADIEVNNHSPLAADFSLSVSAKEYEYQLSEDAPLESDEKYRLRSWHWILLISALVVLSAMAGGLYLFKRKPESPLTLNKSKITAPVATSTPGSKTPIAVKHSAAPSVPVKKTMTSATKPVSAADTPLPSFVTVSGRDRAFTARNPGWERYVEATREIRIYRIAGRIKAVQVLAANGHSLADSFMRDALQEVAGSSEYKLISREHKEGFEIKRNSVGDRSRLIVYHMQPSNKISAFVVQLE